MMPSKLTENHYNTVTAQFGNWPSDDRRNNQVNKCIPFQHKKAAASRVYPGLKNWTAPLSSQVNTCSF